MFQGETEQSALSSDGVTTIKSSCRLCFNGCGVLVMVKDGQPVEIKGDPDHPVSRGGLCPRGRAALELLNHPERLRHPLKRVGRRGQGQWKQISWDEALDTIIEELSKVSTRLGPESVVFMRGGSKGTSDDHLTRLANVFGSPNVSTTSSICYSPCSLASFHTYGFMAYADMQHPPKCIIRWGFNPKVTHPPMQKEIGRAVSAGAKLVVVDPCANETGAELHLRLRPGSDGALALGMAQIILEEGLEDKEFVADWTVGLRRLRTHLQDFTPERVEAMTWVLAEQIRQAARLYATVRPGCILWGNALESGPNNYQACRAICILRALTGNIGRPGSDIKWSADAELHRRAPQFTRPDLLSDKVIEKRLGTQVGLLPAFAYAPHNIVAKAILDDDPYPVRGVYLQGGNLLSASADCVYMAKALGKLDFFAATDQFMTPTTALADIVLPATIYLEDDGVEQPWQWPAAFVQQRVVDPGQNRSESQICNDLVRRIGSGQHAFEDMNEFLDFYLQPAGLSFDEFRDKGALLGTGQPMAHEVGGFHTPSGKVELYSETLERWGTSPLPEYHEPTAYSDEFPLVLTSRKSAVFYHSCGHHLHSLNKICPAPVVRLHPQTAGDLGLEEGDSARVITSRGDMIQRVRLDDRLDPRVAMPEHGWWFPMLGAEQGFGWRKSNLNMLTDASGPCSRELGSPELRGIACRVEPVTGESV